jgi:hypothetical protein
MEEERGRKRAPSIGEYLWNELRQGLQDVRQKLVEEGWFGRVTTAAPVAEIERTDFALGVGNTRASDHRSDFEALWAPREKPMQPVPGEHDHGMDR